MGATNLVSVSIEILAPAEKVYDALTKPEHVKKYLFGTNIKTDWKVGSTIEWTGVWEGKAYKDKGTVLEVIPNKRLVYTYYSGMSKMPDIPENYKTITCKINQTGNKTKLTIMQDNNTKEQQEHSLQMWESVGKTIKQICEG